MVADLNPVQEGLSSRRLLGVRVDATTYSASSRRIAEWAESGEWCYVCVANVHMIMECYDSAAYREIIQAARLVTPDGMPLVWSLRRMGLPDSQRVYGPDLTLAVMKECERKGIPVGFYGGQPAVVESLVRAARKRFPNLQIAYAHSPGFQPLTPDEDGREVARINGSEARVLFVGLGCPKQERWMHEHAGSVKAVMIGVGAAFDFLSGMKRQAPRWMQRAGLEWMFRIATEPRRLWRRYAKTNPRFLFLLLLQLTRLRTFQGLHP